MRQRSLKRRAPRPPRGRWQPRLEALEERYAPSVSILTYHNDNFRTGQDLSETALTPATVNANRFGLLFTLPVDGNVYAQPLYMSGLSIPGRGVHNVIFAATEHDSVYAFDADVAGAPLWQDSFINPAGGVTTVPSTDVNTGAITPEIGITGTPVIDPSTGTLYVVATTKEVSGSTTNYVQRLHALDVTTGAEKFGGPVVIQASVAGSGAGSVGGVLTFDAKIQLQRPGLLLVNSTVYVAWGSYDDQFNYHGWVMGFSAGTLQRTSVWNTTPDGWGAGIWQAGGGLSADAQGNIYAAIGNGTYDVNTGGRDYGDTLAKLSTAGGGLTVADFFTPFNQAYLAQHDLDFGSASAVLLPDQPGAHPQLLTTAGKEGRIYLIDRTSLGGFNAAGDNIVQEIPPAQSYIGNFATPAYFNGTVYYAMSADHLNAYQMSNGLLPTTPTSHSGTYFNFPGAPPSVSANGSSGGIVWVWQYGNPGVLHAYDATNVASELYNSAQSGQRDLAGSGVKFAAPTVAGGKVYAGTKTSLAVFGLFPSAPAPPAAPANLAAIAASAAEVDLSWTNAASNAIAFKVERSTDNVNFAVIDQVAASMTTYADKTVAGSTTYYYRVRAWNTAGDSADSNTATATTPQAPPSDPSLVGYWTFDEGAGTTAADSSGNNDNGTLVGEVTWSQGMVGSNALSFHGVGNQNPHVDVPDSPALRFGATQSFTVGAWVDAFDLPNHWVGIVAKSRDLPPIYGIWIDPSDHWVFGGSSSAPGGGNIVGTLATVGWHYVAAVQDGAAGTRTLYVDGVAVATGPALAADGAGDLWIGGANAADSEYFDGAIDDVRIYNRALAASEIQSIAPALAATYSSGPPTLWPAGATKTYSITVRNVGTQTWNAGGTNFVRLGVEFGTSSDWPHDGWATDQRFFLPYDVAPGQSVNMTVPVTAPATAGTYILRHRMVKENVAWFNQIQKTGVVVDGTPPTVAAAQPANGATGVPAGAPITATFSEAIDQTTLTAANVVLLEVTSGVTLGESLAYNPATYTLTLTPTGGLPANGDTYRVTLKGGVGGVADLAGNPLSSDYVWSFTTAAPAYAAAFVSESVPTSMVAGQTYTVSVTMKNIGTNTWTFAAGYKLGSWNPRDNVTWGLNRVRLAPGGSVAPGAQWTFTFTVRAPSTPGTYNFQWRMLQENVIWFGYPSTNVAVAVTGSAAPAMALSPEFLQPPTNAISALRPTTNRPADRSLTRLSLPEVLATAKAKPATVSTLRPWARRADERPWWEAW